MSRHTGPPNRRRGPAPTPDPSNVEVATTDTAAVMVDDPGPIGPSNEAQPRRIQLSRRRGWRKPAGAIVVTRTSKRWGNPYRVEDHGHDEAIRLFWVYLATNPELVADARIELAGRDLACFCPLDQPCHADVWLEVVNAHAADG